MHRIFKVTVGDRLWHINAVSKDEILDHLRKMHYQMDRVWIEELAIHKIADIPMKRRENLF